MLTHESLERILNKIPHLTLGIIGDLFLDRYLDIDAALTEPSIETGLDAYQVVRVRSYPGAAGTVINNLAALGVASIQTISVIGDDGEGYELRRALADLPGVDSRRIFTDPGRRTPTYTKPMLQEAGLPPRELNRLDIKNHAPISPGMEDRLLTALDEIWPQLDGLIVLDQVDQQRGGVITDKIISWLAAMGRSNPAKLILADSRERIAMFRYVWSKPNHSECLRAVRGNQTNAESVEECARGLARTTSRPVFCTCGHKGMVVVDPREEAGRVVQVPGFEVNGPIDIVGAGDSASAGICCAIAGGAGLEEAAAFANLVASITIQQIGITGTASPDQVRQRWREVGQLKLGIPLG
ncbi:MAG TPA: PfkB family carbohydrate kinase [Gemmataceae bacterium]|nr:PfkB family carbohydrate kinase [Gemmataceae bacterium]